MVRVTRKSTTEGRITKDSSLPKGVPFAVVVESPTGKKKQALLSQYINFVNAGESGDRASSSRKQNTIEKPALGLKHAHNSFLLDAKEISKQKTHQSTSLSLSKEAPKVTSTRDAVGRVSRQTFMTQVAGSQLPYQVQDKNTSKRRRIADDSIETSNGVDQNNKPSSFRDNRDMKSDSIKSLQHNVNLDPSSQETRLLVREQLIREWEAQQDALPTTAERIPASNGVNKEELLQSHCKDSKPFVLEDSTPWTALASSILAVKEDLDLPRPTGRSSSIYKRM